MSKWSINVRAALSAMQAEYTRAVSLLLESAKELNTTSLGRLHREAYHRIKLSMADNKTQQE